MMDEFMPHNCAAAWAPGAVESPLNAGGFNLFQQLPAAVSMSLLVVAHTRYAHVLLVTMTFGTDTAVLPKQTIFKNGLESK